MTDVTPQTLREAIGPWNDPHVNTLLRSAADQLDLATSVLETLTGERDEARAQADDDWRLARDCGLERDEFKAKFDRCFESWEARLKERDEARATIEKVKVWLRTMDGYASTHIAVEGNFDALETILYDAPTMPA